MIIAFVALATIAMAFMCFIWNSENLLNVSIKLLWFVMMVYGVVCFMHLIKV